MNSGDKIDNIDRGFLPKVFLLGFLETGSMANTMIGLPFLPSRIRTFGAREDS